MPFPNAPALIAVLCFGAVVAPALVSELRRNVITNRDNLLLFGSGIAFNLAAAHAGWSDPSLSEALIVVPAVGVMAVLYAVYGGLNPGTAKFLMALSGWFPNLGFFAVIALGLPLPALVCLCLKRAAFPATLPLALAAGLVLFFSYGREGLS